MDTLIVTGGIATGKSTFCKELVRRRPDITVFDCDECVHVLLTTDPIIANVTAVFGEFVLDESGQIDRAKLRGLVFSDFSRKTALEEILHPEVRRLCRSARDEALELGSLFIADVPLFFENDFPLDHDKTLVVATTRATQLQRLLQRGKIAPGIAAQIIDAQLPISQKVALADVVIWNGGRRSSLEQQTEYFLQWMQLPSN